MRRWQEERELARCHVAIRLRRRFHSQPLERHAFSAWMNSLRPHCTRRTQSAAANDGIVSYDRSERIRTYNFPQGRVSDHRINLTLYKLDEILSGDALDEVIDALLSEDQAAKLAAMEEA